MTDIQTRLEFAVQIAREAGEGTLRYFKSSELQVELKEDDSPVTVADKEAELLLRKRIGEQFPLDSILGEEFGETQGDSGYQWVLDPIDGTKSFVAGVPLYTTLVGILKDSESVAGVIFAPATDEMLYAATGSGAWFSDGGKEPERAHVSNVDRMEDALFLTTEVSSFARYRKKDALPCYLDLQQTARLARTWGDAYGYLLVATGRADFMVDPGMNLWDAAPLLPILEEAGGRLTDWKGNRTVHGADTVGSNGLLHDAVLERLAGW